MIIIALIIQLIIILIETIFFAQFSLLGIVPSVSILSLAALNQTSVGKYILPISITSGMIIDVIRPLYSPWFFVIYAVAGLLFMFSHDLNSSVKNSVALVITIIFKHIMFFFLFGTNVVSLALFFAALLDLLLIFLLYIVILQATQRRGSVHG